MKMYGIVVKGTTELLRVRTDSNEGGDFCCSTQYILTDWGNDYPLWLVGNREDAKTAIKESTKWYNAGYETPTWEKKSWDLQVVEVDITVKIDGVEVEQMLVKLQD